MRFYLGTHETSWLGKTDKPLFISRRRLALRKKNPRALGPWALDSGGFTEIKMFGKWVTPARQYVEEVRRWRDEIGKMEWAAIQDWMCEPFMLEKTGKTVKEHQELTLRNYLELREMAPEIPWVPVLQGYASPEYRRHQEMYEKAGIELAKLPTVGLGSICRRQGLITKGLQMCGGKDLYSSDSMSWSVDARYGAPIPGHSHKNCANCLEYALNWRESMLRKVGLRDETN